MTVVVNTFNDGQYLGQALTSVMTQTRIPDEVIVVDDGSAQDPSPYLAPFPAARLIRQQNRGLAGARNTGLSAATSDAIVFLDADDRLLPTALEEGLKALAAAPDAAFAFGGHRLVDLTGRPIGGERTWSEPADYAAFLRCNPIGMHATVTYRREALAAAGGFDASLRRCEDYDAYLRIARTQKVAVFPAVVAEYRKHGANMSANARAMLKTVLEVHDRHKSAAMADPKLAVAWREGRRGWKENYRAEITSPLGKKVKRQIKDLMPSRLRRALFRRLYPNAPALFNDVRFGDIGGTSPLSDSFGYDRGTPIDRGYIEDFLSRRQGDIGGRVLEVGDDAYCRRFGGAAITRQDVLHIDPDAPGATITGDLSSTGLLPKAAFDCLVLTQTLHLVFDMRAAVAEMHRSLKRGGVALVTIPGITRIDRGEWGGDWFWSLTAASARRLFVEAFGGAHVEVEQYGNVYAATAFLQGLALEEVDRDKLAKVDPCFPVIVAVRAVKR